jgi:hypothetical protein
VSFALASTTVVQPTIPFNVSGASAAEWRVNLDEYKGRQIIDVRLWYRFEGGQEHLPTRCGFAFDVKRLPEIRGALRDAEAALLPDTVA